MDIWFVSTSVINICVQVLVWAYVFISLWHVSISGFAGLQDNSLINFLRNCQTVFQSSYTVYIPTCSKISNSPQLLLVIMWLFGCRHLQVCIEWF